MTAFAIACCVYLLIGVSITSAGITHYFRRAK